MSDYTPYRYYYLTSKAQQYGILKVQARPYQGSRILVEVDVISVKWEDRLRWDFNRNNIFRLGDTIFKTPALAKEKVDSDISRHINRLVRNRRSALTVHARSANQDKTRW